VTRWLVVSFALLASGASAEYVPPPTIADLMKAECAAVGRFVVRDGTARFVLTRVLWGDPAPMFGLAALRDGPVRVHENGRVTVWTWR